MSDYEPQTPAEGIALANLAHVKRIEAANERLRQERDDLIGRIGEAIQRNDVQQDAPWLADVLWPQNLSTEQEEG